MISRVEKIGEIEERPARRGGRALHLLKRHLDSVFWAESY